MITRNKYKNKKVTYNGIVFDSEREYKRYLVLEEAQKNGVISDLECHPKWELIPAMYKTEIKKMKTKNKIVNKLRQRAVCYTADFKYIKDGIEIVEDVKISKYLLPKEYILKEKMMLYFHNVEIKRVYKPTDKI